MDRRKPMKLQNSETKISFHMITSNSIFFTLISFSINKSYKMRGIQIMIEFVAVISKTKIRKMKFWDSKWSSKW